MPLRALWDLSACLYGGPLCGPNMGLDTNYLDPKDLAHSPLGQINTPLGDVGQNNSYYAHILAKA